MKNLQEKIAYLKKEKDAVILAHYYVNDEVQEIADYVGDSYYLSKIATSLPNKVICFAGVKFMGESAKILNPEKTILLPEENADCPMAHMADVEEIRSMRERYEDLAVVCYINSSAELKTYSDVCVTSANIYFIPDENLGAYISSQLPEKNIILNNGFCHVHTSISKENIKKAKQTRPELIVLAHPECKSEVLEEADYIGSTSGIIQYATESKGQEFLICTELGVLYELRKKNPDKEFFSVGHRQYCPNMKKISLEKIEECLTKMEPEVRMPEEQRVVAMKPLKRMLELA